jgi:hypothetical protein
MQIIDDAVTSIVETSWRFGKLRGDGNENKTQHSRFNEEPHAKATPY